MANIFKLAKAYVRKHPRTSFQDAIQKVKGKVSGPKKKKPAAKKKSASRQTGTSNKHYDEQRTARAPGARIPAGGKKVTYYERRKNRTDAPGSLTGVSAASLTGELKNRLKDSLGQQLVRRELAKTKREKNKISKTIVSTRSKLKRLL